MIFLRQLQIVVGHHLAVFDGVHARFGGVVRAGMRPAMRGKLQAVAVSFLDHEPDVVHAVNIFLIVHDDLDDRRAVMNIFADGLEHFIARIGERVFRRRQIAFFRLQVKLPAIRRDDAPGIDHRRAGHQRRARWLRAVLCRRNFPHCQRRGRS